MPSPSTVHRYVVSPAAAGERRAEAASWSTRSRRGRRSHASSRTDRRLVSCNTSGRSKPGGGGALDQQVRPVWIVRVVREARSSRRAAPRRASGIPASWVGSCAARLRTPSSTTVRPSRPGIGRGRRRCRDRRPGRAGLHRRDPRRSRPGLRRRSTASPSPDPDRATRAPVVAAPANDVRSTVASSSTRRNAPTSSGLAGNPDSASLMAGASRSASGRLPKRACSSIQPSTHPGTVTLWMSLRNGISANPAARQLVGIGARPGAPAGVQRGDLSVAMDENEQIASHPAQVGSNDPHHGIGGDRGVDRIATAGEHTDSGIGRQLVGRGNRPVDAADRARGGSRHARHATQVHTIVSCRSPGVQARSSSASAPW